MDTTQNPHAFDPPSFSTLWHTPDWILAAMESQDSAANIEETTNSAPQHSNTTPPISTGSSGRSAFNSVANSSRQKPRISSYNPAHNPYSSRRSNPRTVNAVWCPMTGVNQCTPLLLWLCMFPISKYLEIGGGRRDVGIRRDEGRHQNGPSGPGVIVQIQ